MSDRIAGLTVSLRHDMRDDDAEHVINAIRMIKGVVDVSPHIAEPNLHFAKMQVRHEVSEKLWDVINETLK